MRPQHLKFIHEYFKCACDGIAAYQKAYKGANRIAASNGSKKLLRTKEIAAIIKEEQEIRKQLYEQGRSDEIKRMVAEDVASEHEIKSTLTTIVRKRKIKPDPNSKKIIYPSFSEQIHAAKTLNEMCGYDAPKENNLNIKTESQLPDSIKNATIEQLTAIIKAGDTTGSKD